MTNTALRPVTAVILGTLLALSLAPRTSEACSLALPPSSRDLKMLPLANGTAPINTKLWMEREFDGDGGMQTVQLFKSLGAEVTLTETVIKSIIGQRDTLSFFTPGEMLAPNTVYEIRIGGRTRQTFTTTAEFDSTPPELPVLTATSVTGAKTSLGFSMCGGGISASATFEYAPVSELGFLVEPADLVAMVPTKTLFVSGSNTLGPITPGFTGSVGTTYGVLAVDLAGNVRVSAPIDIKIPPTTSAGCSSTSSGPALLGLALLMAAFRRSRRS